MKDCLNQVPRGFTLWQKKCQLMASLRTGVSKWHGIIAISVSLAFIFFILYTNP